MIWIRALANGVLEVILAGLFLAAAVFLRQGPRPGDPYLLVVDIAAAAAVAVTGRFPRAGAAATIGLAVAGLLLDPTAVGLWPMTLMCAVVSLIRLGRWPLVAVALTVLFSCSVATTYRAIDRPAAFAEALWAWGAFDGFFLIFGVGLYATSRYASDLAERKHKEVRLKAMVDLHDLVARDLTILARDAERASVDGASREDLEAMAARARTAGISLRATVGLLASDLDLDDSPGPTFRQALTAGKALLDKAGFQGRTVGDLDAPLPPSIDAAAGRILNEALFNISKHARPHGEWSVAAEISEDTFDLVVTNDRDQTSPTSAGLGTVSIAQFARSVGGEASQVHTDDHWICSVSLPLAEAST